MSAYIVDRTHIDALVRAAISHAYHDMLSWYDMPYDRLRALWGDCDSPETYRAVVDSHHHKADFDQADRIGQMLWLENLASVAYRYPDDTSGNRPGPCDLTDEEIAGYTLVNWQRVNTLSPVAILKAIDGYEYQSCEHPGWYQSEARQFCEALRSATIHKLPGYAEAKWEIAA